MELNLQILLDKLKSDPQKILGKVHNDPLLVKRQCPINTELYVANASKQLFTPTKQEQLYAKGIVYSLVDGIYSLVSMPIIKIYNIGEGQIVNDHVSRMINKENCQVFWAEKADGTLISRFVYKGKVYFSTRGMIETMPGSDSDSSMFFKWTRDIASKKYPELLEPTKHVASTINLELVGPGNQIVTRYDKWDLKLISITRLGADYGYVGQFATTALNTLGSSVKMYKFDGDTLEEQITSLNKNFEGKDDEGCVIQFEKSGKVLGRVKAKTDTYRALLKVMRSCNYESTVELIKKSGTNSWDSFENYLRELGNETVPEELLESFATHFYEHMAHRERNKQINQKLHNLLAMLVDKHKIPHWIDPYSLKVSKEGRKILAEKITKNIDQKLHNFLFASLNNKLTTDYVSDRVKKPEESDEILAALNNITYQNI
jgi:hypothetical protein